MFVPLLCRLPETEGRELRVLWLRVSVRVRGEVDSRSGFPARELSEEAHKNGCRRARVEGRLGHAVVVGLDVRVEIAVTGFITLADLLGIENFDLGLLELLLDDFNGGCASGLIGLGGI